MPLVEFPIRPQMLKASSVIAAKIAASAVTRAKLQYSALQLHVRTSRTVASVAASDGEYSVRAGFACRAAWARYSHAGGNFLRIPIVTSINSSQLRIALYSKGGARAIKSQLTGGLSGFSARIYWTAVR